MSEINWNVLDKDRPIEMHPSLIFPHKNFIQVHEYFSSFFKHYDNGVGPAPEKITILNGSSGCGKTTALRLALDKLSKENPEAIDNIAILSGVKYPTESSIHEFILRRFKIRTNGKSPLEAIAAYIYKTKRPMLIVIDESDRVFETVRVSKKFVWLHRFARLDYTEDLLGQSVPIHLLIVSTAERPMTAYFDDDQIRSYCQPLVFRHYEQGDLFEILRLTAKKAFPDGTYFDAEDLNKIAKQVSRLEINSNNTNARLALLILCHAVHLAVKANKGVEKGISITKFVDEAIHIGTVDEYQMWLSKYSPATRNVLEAIVRLDMEQDTGGTNVFDKMSMGTILLYGDLKNAYVDLADARGETRIAERTFLNILNNLEKGNFIMRPKRGEYVFTDESNIVIEAIERFDGPLPTTGGKLQ